MAELGKIQTKRKNGTTDGRKFDTLEEAQVHSKRLKFREMIGVKSYKQFFILKNYNILYIFQKKNNIY